MILIWQISSLFQVAFVNAATMKITLNGFRKTGWLSSFINNWHRNKGTLSVTLDGPVSGNSCEKTPKVTTGNENDSHVTKLQYSWMHDSTADIQIPRLLSFHNASPKNLLPTPKVKQGEKRVARKKGKTIILISSLYRTEYKVP